MAIMRYVFDELGFHRLDANRLALNQISASLMKKCGFVQEGVKREYIYKGGKYRDLKNIHTLPYNTDISPALPYLSGGPVKCKTIDQSADYQSFHAPICHSV